jgi:hypothetical protein
MVSTNNAERYLPKGESEEDAILNERKELDNKRDDSDCDETSFRSHR